MLAELQMSFICFLVGQVWDAWEQWRSLMSALCRAEELLLQIPELYSKFISILHFQIQEVRCLNQMIHSENLKANSSYVLCEHVYEISCWYGLVSTEFGSPRCSLKIK